MAQVLAEQAFAAAYTMYRHFAEASRRIAYTSEAICVRLIAREVPPAEAVAGVVRTVEGLRVILADGPDPSLL